MKSIIHFPRRLLDKLPIVRFRTTIDSSGKIDGYLIELKRMSKSKDVRIATLAKSKIILHEIMNVNMHMHK